ncbi:hypothetical protein LCGC14_2239020 [marine sediment metagenome]|uniref:Transposase IS4-like domain-containing protein n=1 Tax=marine sediment metagenome TaxID=412755 RepID=A0A0F9D5Q7_9ZZZZ
MQKPPEWIKLSDYLARLDSDDWQQVTWPSQQGGRILYAHLVLTWIRKLRPTLLLITRTSLHAPPKQARFWGSSFLYQDLRTLVDTLAIRWQVETFFEYTKDLLGSDHYQLMTAQAIMRFWTLIACLMAFLEEQRADADDPLLTCGDVRHRIQTEHRLNLLHWLYAQFQSPRRRGQIADQLALSNS